MLLTCSTIKYDMGTFHITKDTVTMFLKLASKLIVEKMIINLNLVYGIIVYDNTL